MVPFKPEMGLFKPEMGLFKHEMGPFSPGMDPFRPRMGPFRHYTGPLRLTKGFFVLLFLFDSSGHVEKIVCQIRLVFVFGVGTFGPLGASPTKRKSCYRLWTQAVLRRQRAL